MPNIGTVLKDEISRLSRRVSRSEIDPTRKATARHRGDIALLKRQVAQLERQVTLLARSVPGVSPKATSELTETRVRFAAKGLRSQRKRLGFSATDFGKLLGVSGQSIYNWERELTHPRGGQVAKLASLRTLGKKEAAERLRALAGANGKSANGKSKRRA